MSEAEKIIWARVMAMQLVHPVASGDVLGRVSSVADRVVALAKEHDATTELATVLLDTTNKR